MLLISCFDHMETNKMAYYSIPDAIQLQAPDFLEEILLQQELQTTYLH